MLFLITFFDLNLVPGEHHQPVRRRQDREDPGPPSSVPEARMEPTVLDDEGVRLRLRQLHSGPALRPPDLAIHPRLQDPAQVHRSQDVPLQILPWTLGNCYYSSQRPVMHN